jgi:hypothetical protein
VSDVARILCVTSSLASISSTCSTTRPESVQCCVVVYVLA